MSAQEEFDRLFITSTEIMRRLGVTRTAMTQARRKGMLPDPIDVEGQLTLWKRKDIEHHVQAWDLRRRQRAGVA